MLRRAGEVYLDKEKAFFQALGGGKVRRGSLLAFLNPASRVWKNTQAAKEVGVPESNLVVRSLDILCISDIPGIYAFLHFLSWCQSLHSLHLAELPAQSSFDDVDMPACVCRDLLRSSL